MVAGLTMHRAARAAAAAALALAAVPARADSLEEVRAALRAIGDRSPITARVERTVTTQATGQDRRTGSASVTVSVRGEGLQILFPAAGLDQAVLEQADSDAEKPHPATQGLRSIDPVDLALLLGYSRRLLAYLDGATLVRETRARYDGAPARLLELDLAVRMSKASRKRISEATSRMKLWIGADGVPLAAEREAHYEGRFMLMHFEGGDSFSLKFGRVGDRLVVLHGEQKSGGSGMGGGSSETRVTTIEPLGGA